MIEQFFISFLGPDVAYALLILSVVFLLLLMVIVLVWIGKILLS